MNELKVLDVNRDGTPIVDRKPTVHEGEVGDRVIVVRDGLYFGRFEKCRNWCGEEFWLIYA